MGNRLCVSAIQPNLVGVVLSQLSKFG